MLSELKTICCLKGMIATKFLKVGAKSKVGLNHKGDLLKKGDSLKGGRPPHDLCLFEDQKQFFRKTILREIN